MKILLDTTYLLPLIGISLDRLPSDIIIRLIERGDDILICEISIFEMLAKGAKYVSLGQLSQSRVLRGIKALLYEERVSRIPVYDPQIISVSLRLREMIQDYIDCLILSSALVNADILLTEDKELNQIYNNNDFQLLIKELNPKFKIEKLSKLLA